MSIKPEYFEYLEHIGSSVTLREFATNLDQPNLITLRHDVDHDIDFALEMSFWEKERGIRSTYFLLHGTDYWDTPLFITKALQIQDLGHEIGLHVNVLSEWMRGKVGSVFKTLERILEGLRQAGLKVCGISSHGDLLCYQHQFINYWCFSELKPDDPIKTESGLTAEGIPSTDQTRSISYPLSHTMKRGNRSQFPLWSVSMEELGITYDATHTSYDAYFTDSHGSWSHSKNPLRMDLREGRFQILIHPEHWRGDLKIYFFLSTARSGSKWLSNFLDKATPLCSRHEFSLNHRFEDGKLVSEKRTAHGFRYLLGRQDEVRKLLIDSRIWIESQNQDFAETNVYLERFLPILREVFPEAIFIHLHRDPKDVVRSIMNRKWYDTPEDDKHPAMELENWESLSQFEKACWYVRITNQSLLGSCSNPIVFDIIVHDFKCLCQTLSALGIAVFPRLGEKPFKQIINSNIVNEFPVYSKWKDEHIVIYQGIMWPVIMALGYEGSYGGSSYVQSLGALLKKYVLKRLHHQRKLQENNHKEHRVQKLANIEFRARRTREFFSKGCKIKVTEKGLVIIPSRKSHAFCVLGGGTWYKLGQNQGWLSKIGSHIRGELEAICTGDGFFQLFCLMYDKKGMQIEKVSLGQFRQRDVELKFSYRPRAQANRFNLAIYMNMNEMPESLMLKSLSVEEIFD